MHYQKKKYEKEQHKKSIYFERHKEEYLSIPNSRKLVANPFCSPSIPRPYGYTDENAGSDHGALLVVFPFCQIGLYWCQKIPQVFVFNNFLMM